MGMGWPRRQPRLVVELRVHGTNGTPPDKMLEESDPKQVAGDDQGRIFRRTEPFGARTKSFRQAEAYHWGRYTSEGASKALWLLMIPFALINVARYTQLMGQERTWREKTHEVWLRLLGLLLTGMLIQAACYICWNIMAQQYSSQLAATDFFLLREFGEIPDGWRYGLASLPPLGIISLLWFFGKQSLKYNSRGPMRRFDRKRNNGDIGDLGFWRGYQSIVQRIAHLWFAISVYGICALLQLGPMDKSATPWLILGHALTAGLLILGILISVLYVIIDPSPKSHVEVAKPEGEEVEPREIEVKADALIRFGVCSTLVVALGSAFILSTDARNSKDSENITTSYDRMAEIFSGSAAVLLFFVFIMCFVQRSIDPGRQLRGKGAPVPKSHRPFWAGFGPWIIASLAVVIGFGFAAAVSFLVAHGVGAPVDSWVSRVTNDPDERAFGESDAPEPNVETCPCDAAGAADIVIPDTYWAYALLWGVLAVIVVALVFPILIHAMRRKQVVWLWVLALAVTLLPMLKHKEFGVWKFAAIALLIGVALSALALKLPRHDFMNKAANDYPDQSGNNITRVNQNAVARNWQIISMRYKYHHVLGTFAGAGGLLVILSGIFLVADVFRGPEPETVLHRFEHDVIFEATQLGAIVLTFLMAALITLGLSLRKNVGVRRQVGILWDLASFWPRMGHPLVPRPYGERAVVAVSERAVQLATTSALFPGSRHKSDVVILSGHSQGSYICLAACAVIHRQSTDDRIGPLAFGKSETTEKAEEESDPWFNRKRTAEAIDKMALLTYGSQMKFIYARLFPRYFGYKRQHEIFNDCLKGRWRNIYRWTDPLGGPVLSWSAPSDDSGPGPLSNLRECMDSDLRGRPAVPTRLDARAGNREGNHYYWKTGPDIRMRDPETIIETPFRPMTPPEGHSSYPGSPVFEKVVEELIGLFRAR
jgi:hypothetical protein